MHVTNTPQNRSKLLHLPLAMGRQTLDPWPQTSYQDVFHVLGLHVVI